ncbi:hypothetical protein [uncultured Friedmanniella sp.]|uniref:hypothetical protein n=1 Tax=uncultured Friedmanniella sp. TaxID=335381 RepID=UPI0035CA2758
MLVPLHGIASRHDLPLPFSFLVVGAAVALTVSFVVLLLAWRHPRYTELRGRPLPLLTRLVDSPVTRAVLRLAVLALYAWVALALMLGRDLLTNPVFGFVFVWLWVGLVPVSLLLGPVWRVANPLRTVHRLLCALARVDPEVGILTLPSRLGVWPAAVGLFGFAWLELVQPDRTTLAVLRVWVLAWFVLGILGAIVFGSRWIGAADPFEAYATTVAQLSPFRTVKGELRLVHPLGGLASWRPPPGAVGVVAALLGSTAFDSFANLSWWIQTVQSSSVISVVWASGGLVTMIALVAVSFALAAAWMGRYGDRPAAHYPRLMAGSVVPIVVGYAVAHYFTLLVVEGQHTAVLLSDPLGRGWNALGTADLAISSTIFNHPTLVATLQAFAIVGGHVLGIISAHEKAVALLPERDALRGQWPMLAVMIGYTCAGLVLLFSP